MSYTNKKPDASNSEEKKVVCHVPKPPHSFEFKYSKHGRDDMFDFDCVYIGIHTEMDTKIQMLVHFKTDPRN